MKKIMILLVLLVSLTSVWGDSLFDRKADTQGKESMKRIFSAIAEHPLMKSAFVQRKNMERINRTFESSGTILFDSSQGIAWIFEKPFPSMTVITDQTMIQKDSRGNIQQIGSNENEVFSRFSRTVQSIFVGDFDLIEKEYELFCLEPEENDWTIGLIPRDPTLKNIIKSFKLTGSRYIKTFLIHDSNGGSVLYEFSNTEFPNKMTADDRLVFRK